MATVRRFSLSFVCLTFCLVIFRLLLCARYWNCCWGVSLLYLTDNRQTCYWCSSALIFGNKKPIDIILIFNSPFPNLTSICAEISQELILLYLAREFSRENSWGFYFLCAYLDFTFQQALLLFEFTFTKTALRFFHWPWQRGI